MSKGSTRRPSEVDESEAERRWQQTFAKPEPDDVVYRAIELQREVDKILEEYGHS